MRVLLPPDRGAVRGPARAAVLMEWMTAWLGMDVQVDILPTYRDVALAIERGETDLAWAPPAVCARVRGSVRSVLTVVRYGASGCRAALVARAGSGIRELRDLAGLRASWVDPLSTSGYLMVLAHLRDAGLDAERLFASQRFAGSYRDALADVIAHRADVSSFFVVAESVEKTLVEIRDVVGSTAPLELVCMTAPAPYDALVVPKLAPDSRALEQRLLSLDQRMSPPAFLLEVCRADRFVRGSIEEYARFEKLLDAMAFDGA